MEDKRERECHRDRTVIWTPCRPLHADTVDGSKVKAGVYRWCSRHLPRSEKAKPRNKSTSKSPRQRSPVKVPQGPPSGRRLSLPRFVPELLHPNNSLGALVLSPKANACAGGRARRLYAVQAAQPPVIRGRFNDGERFGTPKSTASATTATRMERDTMGDFRFPQCVLWRANGRAIENFPISSLHAFPRAMIRAWDSSNAAASVNHSLKLLDKTGGRHHSAPRPKSLTGAGRRISG